MKQRIYYMYKRMKYYAPEYNSQKGTDEHKGIFDETHYVTVYLCLKKV